MANKWDNLLNDLSTSGGGPFFYPKDGRVQFRIVPEDNENGEAAEGWFRMVEDYYQGKRKEKYIIRAIVVMSDQGEISERYRDKIVPVVISKSAFTGIIQILADDEFPLLNLAEGHGVTHTRQGQGMGTSYHVQPTRKPIPVDLEDYEVSSDTLDDWAEAYGERNTNRGQTAPSDEETGW